MSVVPAVYFGTNAELIRDVARLHCFDRGWKAIDPTYGRGLWWKLWRPTDLTVHDLDPRRGDGVDYRKLPEDDDTFTFGAFDPPYVSQGGRHTSTIPEWQDRYGVKNAAATPRALQDYNDDGLAEMWRVLAPGAFLLVKCQDYVTSGRLQPGTFWTQEAAYGLGFQLVDRVIHAAKGRPQPQGRSRQATKREIDDGLADEQGRMLTVQHHAQPNPSTLYVFRKPRRQRKETTHAIPSD